MWHDYGDRQENELLYHHDVCFQSHIASAIMTDLHRIIFLGSLRLISKFFSLILTYVKIECKLIKANKSKGLSFVMQCRAWLCHVFMPFHAVSCHARQPNKFVKAKKFHTMRTYERRNLTIQMLPNIMPFTSSFLNHLCMKWAID